MTSMAPTPAVETEYPTGWKAPSVVIEFTSPSVPQDGDGLNVPIVDVGDTPIPTAQPTLMGPKVLDITQSVEAPRDDVEAQIPMTIYGVVFFLVAIISYLGWRRHSRGSSSSTVTSSRGGYEKLTLR